MHFLYVEVEYSFKNRTNDNKKLSFLYKQSILDDMYYYCDFNMSFGDIHL